MLLKKSHPKSAGLLQPSVDRRLVFQKVSSAHFSQCNSSDCYCRVAYKFGANTAVQMLESPGVKYAFCSPEVATSFAKGVLVLHLVLKSFYRKHT